MRVFERVESVAASARVLCEVFCDDPSLLRPQLLLPSDLLFGTDVGRLDVDHRLVQWGLRQPLEVFVTTVESVLRLYSDCLPFLRLYIISCVASRVRLSNFKASVLLGSSSFICILILHLLILLEEQVAIL